VTSEEQRRGSSVAKEVRVRGLGLRADWRYHRGGEKAVEKWGIRKFDLGRCDFWTCSGEGGWLGFAPKLTFCNGSLTIKVQPTVREVVFRGAESRGRLR
jgi:hypothetical protein